MSTNPFELTFSLRQHTPIIHFQHHQDGATLRATEVKPKLDRFLIEMMGSGNYDAGALYAKRQKWLIGEGSNGNALDYKMRIIAQDAPEKVEIKKGEPFPCFFANIGNEYDPKKFVFHTEPIKLQIICLQTELKTFIQTHFNHFMAQTNFGMRQSKGFGSFAIDGQKIERAYASYALDSATIKKLIEQIKKTRGASPLFIEETNSKYSFQALFKAIDLFYRSLRGGVRTYGGGGVCKFYFKPLLVAYYNENILNSGIDWDKKAIKQTLVDGKIGVLGTDIKDLFGFSTNETWKECPEWATTIIKKRDKREEDIKSIEAKIQTVSNSEKQALIDEKNKLSDELVERFASPIIFKPIYENGKWRIYIYHKAIPKTYKNTTVLADVNGHDVALKMWDSASFPFYLSDFFDFIENYKDNKEFDAHIKKYDERGHYFDFLRHQDYHNLKTLFSTYKTL